jgi:adenosylhomocysteine nucleosidase
MIILFVALISELGDESVPDGVTVVETGVGKINATMAATTARWKWGTDAVWVNWGTAGSDTVPVGSVVQCREFRQADADWRPICPKGHTPFDDCPATIPGSRLGVTCWTADKWETGGESGVWDCEGYALAKVAREWGIPFMAWKWISDSGDSDEWSDHAGGIRGIGEILHGFVSQHIYEEKV